MPAWTEEPRERTEALEALELVAFRRVGAGRVHFALLPPALIANGSVLGTPCAVVSAPVVAFCGRSLRGLKVVIPAEHLEGWRQNGDVCRECAMVARMALERAAGESEAPR